MKTWPKPYGFVPLPETFTAARPIWHDGSGGTGLLSGEIRLELTTLTPTLVGWERASIEEARKGAWPAEASTPTDTELQAFRASLRQQLDDQAKRNGDESPDSMPEGDFVRLQIHEDGGRRDLGIIIESKNMLAPLRAAWMERAPVILQGDSLKGLLRHELGALFGAPMERVAERTYSYRPNLKFPQDASKRRLEPRLARVKTQGSINVRGYGTFPVPVEIDVMEFDGRDRYYPNRDGTATPAVAGPYLGGLAGGKEMPRDCRAPGQRRVIVHTHLHTAKAVDHPSYTMTGDLHEQFGRTLEHLLATNVGHFSGRHPGTGNNVQKQEQAAEAVRDAAARAFKPGHYFWVEWDTQTSTVTSFGWQYYYRWAYQDTVRKAGWASDRGEVSLHPDEAPTATRPKPAALTPVRRLFGFVGGPSATMEIGKDDYAQLMGRVFVNSALEVTAPGETHAQRFLPPMFLKELGMPRPSAVEHYLQQPFATSPRSPRNRGVDRASLLTYGDARGIDTPGKLAGRKFYFDRPDAYRGAAMEAPSREEDGDWVDDSPLNRANKRSTFALEASRPGRAFRFTIRFRDLEAGELLAILLALCPNQFAEALGRSHAQGYCSKIGYARPLGWGSARIEAKQLLFLNWTSGAPALDADGVMSWFARNRASLTAPALEQWFAVHRCKHPDAASYPVASEPRKPNKKTIYMYHTSLRAGHSLDRRYTP